MRHPPWDLPMDLKPRRQQLPPNMTVEEPDSHAQGISGSLAPRIPVIAEDAFMMPSDAFFTELASKSVLDEQQLLAGFTV